MINISQGDNNFTTTSESDFEMSIVNNGYIIHSNQRYVFNEENVIYESVQ